MCEIKHCVWLDDVTNQFATVYCITPVGPAIKIWQARKISIFTKRKVVVINPIPDDDDDKIINRAESEGNGNAEDSPEPGST